MQAEYVKQTKEQIDEINSCGIIKGYNPENISRLNNEQFTDFISKNGPFLNYLVKYYKSKVFRAGFRLKLSFSEIYQSICLSIWKSLPTYNSGMGMTLSGYLKRAAYWELKKEFKRVNKQVVFKPEKSVNIDRCEFEDCLKTVPEPYQQVLRLYYLEGKKLGDIGLQIGRTAEMVRQYKNSGLEIFKKRWMS